jgi:hypothetical protein
MPTIETNQWLAIKAQVEVAVAAMSLPVAWPNESFVKPEGNYLRVTHVPNTNQRRSLRGADAHRRLSLLQIDVFGKKNLDASVSTELAGRVATYFPADFVMVLNGVRTRVVKAPDVAQSLPGDTHVQTPVMIQLECLA